MNTIKYMKQMHDGSSSITVVSTCGFPLRKLNPVYMQSLL